MIQYCSTNGAVWCGSAGPSTTTGCGAERDLFEFTLTHSVDKLSSIGFQVVVIIDVGQGLSIDGKVLG